MASGNGKVGYGCKFIDTPPKQVQSECPACHLILREPYQATCCGHSFCHVCIEKIKSNNDKRCPLCKDRHFINFPDKGLQRTLYGFMVHCINHGIGCKWTGKLGELDGHLNLGQVKSLSLELRTSGCQYVEIPCVYCSFKVKRLNIRTHMKEDCRKRPFTCPYCRKYESTFEDVVSNHWPECVSSFSLLACPNNCGAMIQRRCIEEHISDDCPSTVVDCSFKGTGCSVRLPRTDMIAHIVDTHLMLKPTVVSQPAYVAPVEFLMPNFTAHRSVGARSWWYSPPFYSHVGGYKMFLEIDAKDRSILLSARLMPSEYDHQLGSRPFRGNVTVRFLNQSMAAENVDPEYTVVLPFGRRSPTDTNHSCYKYISMTVLSKYVRCGSLKMRVEVAV